MDRLSSRLEQLIFKYVKDIRGNGKYKTVIGRPNFFGNGKHCDKDRIKVIVYYDDQCCKKHENWYRIPSFNYLLICPCCGDIIAEAFDYL